MGGLIFAGVDTGILTSRGMWRNAGRIVLESAGFTFDKANNSHSFDCGCVCSQHTLHGLINDSLTYLPIQVPSSKPALQALGDAWMSSLILLVGCSPCMTDV